MKNFFTLFNHMLYRFIVYILPIMISGFIIFTIAFYYLGHYLQSRQQEVADAFQESGAGQVYVCQSPEDCERIRLRNEEYSQFAGA